MKKEVTNEFERRETLCAVAFMLVTAVAYLLLVGN
jgi:hypothetical protein